MTSDASAAPATALALHHTDHGAGPPLLFLHGWGMSLEVWERQVHELAVRHRVVCADLRGHGRSPTPLGPYGYDDHCADIARLLATLTLEDVTLVGWSMSGSIGARLAHRCPQITRLVLVGSPPRLTWAPDFPHGADPAGCLEFRAQIASDRQAAMWQTAGDTLHRRDADPTRRWLHQLTMRAPLWALLGCYDGVIAADVREELRALAIPTLVVHGRHDPYVAMGAAEWTAEHVAGARFERFEDSGHAPFLDEPERFSAALDAFLA